MLDTKFGGAVHGCRARLHQVVTVCYLWAGGRDYIHVGASGMIYGLIGYLLFDGLFSVGWPPKFSFSIMKSVLLTLTVAFLYSGLVWALLPQLVRGGPVSWELHLSGFIGGCDTKHLHAISVMISGANLGRRCVSDLLSWLLALMSKP